MKRSITAVLLLGCIACGHAVEEPAEPARLRLATTTSTENSGLLDLLLSPFEEANGVEVDVIAVGTGKALRLGENGDVDVVLVHARGAEDAFVAAGHGVGRRDVMHNDFLVLGPTGDPAGVGSARSAAEAFGRIAEARAPFVSRGDDSGTHKKELGLWEAAGVRPQGGWYREAGQGMGAVLRIADEGRAYTLSDRGTWLAYRDRLDLASAFEGDPALHNPYGIIAVNPERHPHVSHEMASKLIRFVTGPEGQSIIAGFRIKGERLFHPATPPRD